MKMKLSSDHRIPLPLLIFQCLFQIMYGSPPVTNRGELNKVAIRGSHLVLPCFTSFFKSPEVFFQWKKDGLFLVNTRNPIPKDSRLSIFMSNGSLKIDNVTYQDEGLYLCETFDYKETTLLRITLYVIDSHPRHYRYNSEMIRAHDDDADFNVAYHLPLLGICLVIIIFMIINCYKRESAPNIPDYTETSLMNQLFSRAFRKYQSFLLPKIHYKQSALQQHHGPIVNPDPSEDIVDLQHHQLYHQQNQLCASKQHKNQLRFSGENLDYQPQSHSSTHPSSAMDVDPTPPLTEQFYFSRPTLPVLSTQFRLPQPSPPSIDYFDSIIVYCPENGGSKDINAASMIT